jgi:hypothetical protein
MTLIVTSHRFLDFNSFKLFSSKLFFFLLFIFVFLVNHAGSRIPRCPLKFDVVFWRFGRSVEAVRQEVLCPVEAPLGGVDLTLDLRTMKIKLG